MAGRATLHLKPGRAANRRTLVDSGDAVLPLPVVITLGMAASWVALVSGLQLVSTTVFGMAAREGWAFAISIVAYISMFVGFVVGLVLALNAEDRAGRNV